MNYFDAPDWARPLPEVDAVSAPYWAAAAEGRLLLEHCGDCDRWQHYPRAFCGGCGGVPELVDAAGDGVVYTFTIVRQYSLPPFDAEVPYVVAMVELAEGPRVLTNIIDCEPEAVSIGASVSLVTARVTPGVGIPLFRLGSPSAPPDRQGAALAGSGSLSSLPETLTREPDDEPR